MPDREATWSPATNNYVECSWPSAFRRRGTRRWSRARSPPRRTRPGGRAYSGEFAEDLACDGTVQVADDDLTREALRPPAARRRRDPQVLARRRIDAIELALADYEAMFGHPLAALCPVDAQTGELLPVVTIVTDNGGPFRSFRFEAFIELHPELHHVRTRVRTPGQNGSRERGFGTLKYERLFIDEIDDALMLAQHSEEYRLEYNTIRPHEAIAWNRPQEVHLGLADPKTPTFHTKEILPTT